MTDPTRALPSPTYRRQGGEMVPRLLLRAMLALALSALAITSFAVLTGREPVAQPQAAEMVRERWLVLEGHDAQAVTVRTPDGKVLVDLPHGGFVTVVQSGMATERKKYGVDPLRPVRLVEYANGRLAIEDPDTGWSIELYAFGSDNKAAFVRLFDQE
ncbi:MAG: photosynthetic complex assembly protein [Rhodobacterales bacterium 12-65-15]|nr:MAG: photosynthetic complex assembly protein [Rhodobacterales bacterium 12-65-15]